MKQLVTIVCVFLVLVGCASSPRIIPLTDKQPGLPSLQELANGKSQLIVIFIHGVGEHCPGYAFGTTRSHTWVDGKAFRELGIRRLDVKQSAVMYLTPVFSNADGTAVEVGLRHNLSGHNKLGNLVTRVKELGRIGSVPVSGVEITWSELTYGMKREDLSFDITSEGRTNNERALKHDSGMRCFKKLEDQEERLYGQYIDVPPPPARATINRDLKEGLVDDGLSDAILDLGPYREVIERAVAQGICEAIDLTARRVLPSDDSLKGPGSIESGESECWYRAEGDFESTRAKNTEYIVITHSLGSRIVYDIVRYLNQIDPYHDSTFARTKADVDAFDGFDVFPMFTRRLGAVYMMANQLPLLGLGMGGPIRDLAARNPGSQMITKARRIPGPPEPEDGIAAHCDESFGEKRPEFVAFVDTNDVLSWGIMPTMDPRCFRFLTIYVNNSWWHWFGLFESPSAAHSGYLQNRNVGRLIACGTRDDFLRKDCELSVAEK